MIYIANPYSHKTDSDIMTKRFKAAEAYLVQLLRQGEVAYSPIVHSHQLAVDHVMPTTYAFWSKHCLAMVDLATELHVLMLPGWKESIGVKDEISRAMSNGIGVKYIVWRIADD